MIILGMILGMISFTFLCEGFNKMEIQLCEALQKKTRALGKKKKWFQYGIFLGITIIVLIVVALVGLGELGQGFLIGTIWALNDFIFEDSIFDRLRNTLR